MQSLMAGRPVDLSVTTATPRHGDTNTIAREPPPLRLDQYSRRDKNKQVWQENIVLGWTYMLLYWMAGAVVGMYFGYFAKFWPLFPTFHDSDTWCFFCYYAVAALVTLACQPALLRRFGRFGRRPSWVASILFALCNGTFETILFAVTYDAGKLVARYACGTRCSKWILVTTGFVAYMIYSAFIHAEFWLPRAFPRHALPDAPPFHTTMLPALVAVSAAWLLVLYEPTHNVGAVASLHVIMNACFAWHMALPAPWLLLGCKMHPQ